MAQGRAELASDESIVLNFGWGVTRDLGIRKKEELRHQLEECCRHREGAAYGIKPHIIAGEGNLTGQTQSTLAFLDMRSYANKNIILKRYYMPDIRLSSLNSPFFPRNIIHINQMRNLVNKI